MDEMNETAHTPTPWHVDGTSIRASDGYGIDWYITEALEQAGDSDPGANAEYIVRAVNSHEALLAALEAIVNTYRTFRNVSVEDQGWTALDDEALEAGFAAIAAARGGTK